MGRSISIFILLLMCFVPTIAIAGNDCDQDAGCSEELTENNQSHVNFLTFEEFITVYESDEDYILVDVRSKPNYDFQHIKGAQSLYVQRATPDQINQVLPDKDQKIVVYCSSRSCPMSQYAARFLMSLGYSNVFDYNGGLQEWRTKGKPVGKFIADVK